MELEVLLLDEPSSALDEETEHLIIESLVRETIQKNNKTPIMVTHSKKVATHFSDELIEMIEGKVINQEGMQTMIGLQKGLFASSKAGSMN